MDSSATQDGSADTNDLYFVVRNHEEQYSIWRDGRPVPAGWEVVGTPAPKAQCLERIGELWTDMRPASLRRLMGADASS
jgi:MbtH protein